MGTKTIATINAQINIWGGWSVKSENSEAVRENKGLAMPVCLIVFVLDFAHKTRMQRTFRDGGQNIDGISHRCSRARSITSPPLV